MWIEKLAIIIRDVDMDLEKRQALLYKNIIDKLVQIQFHEHSENAVDKVAEEILLSSLIPLEKKKPLVNLVKEIDKFHKSYYEKHK